MSSRFKFEGKYAMRIIDKKSLLAYFNVIDTEIGIEFRDARLIEGKNGVFVSAPFRSYEDKQGETKYADYWRASFEGDVRSEAGMAYMEDMAQAAHAYYLSLSENGGAGDEEGGGEEEEAPAPAKAAARAATPAARAATPAARAATPAKSGRGAVPPKANAGAGARKLPF